MVQYLQFRILEFPLNNYQHQTYIIKTYQNTCQIHWNPMKFQISSDMGRTVLLHQSSKISAGTVLQDQVPALPGSPHQRGTLQNINGRKPTKKWQAVDMYIFGWKGNDWTNSSAVNQHKLRFIVGFWTELWVETKHSMIHGIHDP